jgi:hypothetical protein
MRGTTSNRYIFVLKSIVKPDPIGSPDLNKTEVFLGSIDFMFFAEGCYIITKDTFFG